MVGGLLDTTINLEADGSNFITPDHVEAKISRIASYFLASGSKLDDGA